MNTQTRLHELQAGEALAVPGASKGRIVLVEGEVLFQAPALYVAGTVIVPPARRITAPASFPVPEAGSVRAASAARLVFEQAPGWGATLLSFLAGLRRRYSVAVAPAGARPQRT